jgi:hypothetical protein
MAFTDEDIESLSDEFISEPGPQVVTPRKYEREHGGNAGFHRFSRAVEAPPEPTKEVQSRKCYRCKDMVHDGGRLCVRHKEQHRVQAAQRVRALGFKEWVPGGPGRPPKIQREAAKDAEVILRAAILNDACAELTALKYRIAHLKRELAEAVRAASTTALRTQRLERLRNRWAKRLASPKKAEGL